MYFEAAGNVGKTLDELQRSAHGGPSRKVLVPDFVGVRGDDIWLVGLKGGVKIELHRVAEQHPGEIMVVVAQEPAAGRKVRRDSPVKVSVGYEPN
jgi:hypothetical protein